MCSRAPRPQGAEAAALPSWRGRTGRASAALEFLCEGPAAVLSTRPVFRPEGRDRSLSSLSSLQRTEGSLDGT